MQEHDSLPIVPGETRPSEFVPQEAAKFLHTFKPLEVLGACPSNSFVKLSEV